MLQRVMPSMAAFSRPVSPTAPLTPVPKAPWRMASTTLECCWKCSMKASLVRSSWSAIAAIRLAAALNPPSFNANGRWPSSRSNAPRSCRISAHAASGLAGAALALAGSAGLSAAPAGTSDGARYRLNRRRAAPVVIDIAGRIQKPYLVAESVSRIVWRTPEERVAPDDPDSVVLSGRDTVLPPVVQGLRPWLMSLRPCWAGPTATRTRRRHIQAARDEKLAPDRKR